MQKALQESFPPLLLPGTLTPTRRERCASSIQPAEDYDVLWLRSPSLEVKIKRPEWKPNPRLHPDLVVVVKKVVNSMPTHYLLFPKTGEEFDLIEAVFNRLQDYMFIKGFLIIKYSGNLIGTKKLC